jgi:phosphatidylserine/phosphatidylglycerophosphate/cardiolipin synthase-like enzyme
MRRFAYLFSLVLVLAWSGQAVAESMTLNNTPVEVFFSPKGGAQDAIVREIGKAKSSILVQAFNFNNLAISKALAEAKKRGVAVAVILDKSNRTDNHSVAPFLKSEGIPVMIDAMHAVAHNKVMVIDADTVITGSYNFTRGAEESNAENLLVIRSKEMAKRYSGEWAEHKKHSEVY